MRGHVRSPGPRGEEALRRDAARNRERILAAARSLFAERGVTGVTMSEIARAAGVGKGTLYRRFPNKGLLCEALLDEPTRAFQRRVMELVAENESGALEKLGRFLEEMVFFTEENLELLYGGQEPLCGSARVERFSHPAYDWQRWTVLVLLRQAEREGEIRENLDLEYLAHALLAPLAVDLYYYQRYVLGFSPERIARGLRDLASERL
ncbi:TetR/AcrR family transcriptional regulator [Rubrobacter xylanophilus]|uniref:TetR/AcrR family transcriptional regulator n=1 Tax=Rubrobacter xylanophilus TaxID=49319 RepID=UPI001FCAA007|nr:TetR/AcrR family transcriptional regulator [Rubrobacter xylanophilus]